MMRWFTSPRSHHVYQLWPRNVASFQSATSENSRVTTTTTTVEHRAVVVAPLVNQATTTLSRQRPGRCRPTSRCRVRPADDFSCMLLRQWSSVDIYSPTDKHRLRDSSWTVLYSTLAWGGLVILQDYFIDSCSMISLVLLALKAKVITSLHELWVPLLWECRVRCKTASA